MLDYTQRTKKVLEVKLADDTILKIGAPKKKLFSRLAGLEKTLKATKEIEPMYDDILSVAADVLSNNTERRVFTPDDVDEIMDIEDMALLLRAYSEFAGNIANAPN